MARGSIQEAGKDKWRLRLYIGEDAEGKQRYWHHTHNGRKKEAEAILSEKIVELQQTGTIIGKQKVLIEKYLKDWKETSVKASVSKKTLESYDWIINNYLIPELGMYQLSKLTAQTIQKLYNNMTDKGLSPRTVRYAHSVLRKALHQAVRWKMIPSNPADLTTLPKQIKKEMQAMNENQVKAFLKAAEGDRCKPLFETLIITGMRYGEAYGLKWSDVDLDNNCISIKRALSRPRNTDWLLAEPKTQKSKRTIAIPEKLTETLKRQKAKIAADKLDCKVRAETLRQKVEEGKMSASDAERIKETIIYTDHGFVFPGIYGQPLDHTKVVSRHFKPMLKAAGLEGFRPYDLRHTAATLLLKAGIPVKTVSDRLGHSNASTTLNVYAHVLPGMQEEASDKIAAMIY